MTSSVSIDQNEMDNNLNNLLEDALEDLLAETPNVAKKQEGKVEPTPTTSETKKSKSKPEHSKKVNKTGPVDEEEMDRFFANMTQQLKAELPKIDPEEAQARINESVPQIFDLMQNLLSKELLYPALNDLSPKYDEWFEKNQPKLSKADKKRYSKQRDLIREIIKNFDDDSLDNQAKFVKNIDLMEEMQSLGPPPDELTVPGGPKCPIM